MKSPIGNNIFNCKMGIYECGNTESENKSAIPNWINITNWGFEITIVDIIPNWVFSSVSPVLYSGEDLVIQLSHP